MELEKNEPQQQLISCPTLKFRILNQFHSTRRGEIIDAKLNAVATIDAKNSFIGIHGQEEFGNALDSKARRIPNHTLFSKFSSASTFLSNHSSGINAGRKHSVQEENLSELARMRMDVLRQSVRDISPEIIDQDEETKPNLVFSNISVQPANQPFFKTAWNVNHR